MGRTQSGEGGQSGEEVCEGGGLLAAARVLETEDSFSLGFPARAADFGLANKVSQFLKINACMCVHVCICGAQGEMIM